MVNVVLDDIFIANGDEGEYPAIERPDIRGIAYPSLLFWQFV